MKKFLLPMLAILLAVGFSAFTTDNRESKTDAIQDELYWYRIDASGKIGSALNSEVLSTKTEVFTEAGCPDETGDDCARGYEETQTFGATAPNVTGSDRHIMDEEL
jgi:hypothetical protein